MSATTSSSVSTPNSSLWKLPGLDEDSFYAAALLLSVSNGNINAGRHYREPKTPEDVRDFLDHLADCFARSKLRDRSDHVTATAMVKNENQKTITLYIAKNQSEKRFGPGVSLEERGQVQNENDDFAKRLIEWFNLPDDEDATPSNHNDQSHPTIFTRMCDFNRSRLEHYIEEIRMADVDALDTVVEVNLGSDLDARSLKGWKKAKDVITECQDYKISTNDSQNPSEEISSFKCAKLAGHVRGNADFQRFVSVIETLPESKRIKAEKLTYVAGGIKYLGRLFTAYKHFQSFCNTERRNGFLFDYELLPSSDFTWDGDTYLRKIESWAEVLNISELRKSIDSATDPGVVWKKISDIVKGRNNKAPVHCEMQLLMRFSRPNAEKCEDYFGCSKKSCWLCWQMILMNSRFVMKDTHRKIYPAWVFPFDYSASQPAIAEGLITAYNEMLRLVQENLIKRTSFTFLEPLVQSSFRMTPAYRRGPLNPYSDDSAKSEKFPEPIIAVSGRWAAHLVRAIHLPEHGSPSTSRIVDIHAYEATESELVLTFMNFHRFLDKKCIFAFELKTNAGSLNLDSEIEDYQRAHWSVAHIYMNENLYWRMFFRTAYETLNANPYISSLCAKTQPEISQPIPWRGDIFIVPSRLSGDYTDFRPESLDELPCLEALESILRRCSKKWDPERAAKDEFRIADDGLEYYKIGLRRDAIGKKSTDNSISVDEFQRLGQQYDELSSKITAMDRKLSNLKLPLSTFVGGL